MNIIAFKLLVLERNKSHHITAYKLFILRLLTTGFAQRLLSLLLLYCLQVFPICVNCWLSLESEWDQCLVISPCHFSEIWPIPTMILHLIANCYNSLSKSLWDRSKHINYYWYPCYPYILQFLVFWKGFIISFYFPFLLFSLYGPQEQQNLHDSKFFFFFFPVGWGCRIHQLLHCKVVDVHPQWVSWIWH